MKSRKRISVKLVLLSSFFAALTLSYWHFGLFPGKLKTKAVEKIFQYTQIRVDFKKALLLPLEGLSFYDLRVADKSYRPIFSCKKFSLNAKLLPFLREKKVVISNVYLDSPVYILSTEPTRSATPPPPPPKTKISGQIVVPTIPTHKKIDASVIDQGANAFLPENVYLEQIEIANGTVAIRKNPSSPVIEELRNINIRMTFQKPPHLGFDGSLDLGRDHYSTINLKGVWDLDRASYVFRFYAKTSRIPSWLLEYQKNHFLILQKGAASMEVQLQSIEEERAIFRAKAHLKESNLAVKKIIYTGEMKLDTRGVFNFERKNFERYTGTLDLIDVDVWNLSPQIPHIENLKGSVAFEPDLLKIVGLNGRYENIIFDASGVIRSFKDLMINLSIKVAANVSHVISLFPAETKKLLKNYSIQGNCDAITIIHGSLRDSKSLQKDYKLILKNGTVQSSDKKVDLSQVSVEVLANAAGFELKNGHFISAKKEYSVSASVPKNPEKLGALDLRSKDFTLKASYRLDDKNVLFKNAAFQYQGFSATFQGKLYNLDNPALDILGRMEADLLRLKPFFMQYAPGLSGMGLRGRLKGPFSLSGPWKRVADWDLKIDGGADTLFLQNTLRLDNFEAQIRMKNHVLDIPYFHAQFYKGSLGGDSAFHLQKPGTPFRLKLYANSVDLEEMLSDSQAKNKDLSGKLTFQTKMDGLLKKQESFRGSGTIDIRGGKLWETDMFKQMGQLPFVKVEGLDQVVFSDLNASFVIRDKKVRTNNLNIFSDTVNLSMDGDVGFDQTLDLTMDIRYSDDIIRGAFDTGGIVPFVVTEAEGLISQYKISGTLSAPKYDKKMSIPGSRTIGKKLSGLVSN